MSLFLGIKKQQNLSSHILSHTKRLFEILQKAYEKCFSSAFSADLSSIYSLIIFLKRVFWSHHYPAQKPSRVLHGHSSTQKPHSKQFSAYNSLQLPSPSALHCFLIQLLSKQNRQPAILNKLKFPFPRIIDSAWLPCNFMYLYSTLPHLSVL